MKIGVSFLRAHPRTWLDVAVAAEELGYESVWISDHLALPVEQVSRYPGADNPDSPGRTIGPQGPSGATFPLFDAPAYLAAIAARTSRIRLGTYVYLLGLRHPLITARAFQTVDAISRGRVELGVGSGWLREEWRAAGMDWATRGPALDEAIEVCRRLWSEPTVEHRGATWSFDPVYFEPKPVQPGGPPILVGGESAPALRRAARLGDGWIALEHTPESVRAPLERLRAALDAADRPHSQVPVTVAAVVETPDDLRHWEKLGVDRLIVSPWDRSRDSIAGMTALAECLGLS
jgi:probable F420-dependent oxidoreductase